MTTMTTQSRVAHDAVALRTLVVGQIELQGDGAVAVIELVDPDGELPEAEPGAHVDVLLPNGLERQYSLAGGRPGRWRLGVLREPESRGGSSWIHENLRAGDLLQVRGPRNNFPLVAAPRYVFVAGGIGITPLLPMIREVAARGAEWTLLYGGRSRRSLAFLDELAAHGDLVTVWPQDENGLIDVPGVFAGLPAGSAVYCCGPSPLLDAMEAEAEKHPHVTLHLERFRPREGALDGERSAFEVHLDYSGITVQVGPDQSIAEALEAAGVEVMTSCREGTCGTCETVVLDGVPDHRDSYLSPAERASNEVMMICCSRARTPRLVLDL